MLCCGARAATANLLPPLSLALRPTARMLLAPGTKPRDSLGDEMKAYEDESASAASVDITRPVVVRLDGHCFSTFTRGFERPYDLRIHRAMVNTATDLVERFGAVTAYTESDEISLLFPSHTGEAPSPLPFSGRVQKIASVFAGFASARFNLHMRSQPFDVTQAQQALLHARVEACEAHFDARIFTLPSLDRVCAYLQWRAVHDCRRNSISMLAQAHFTHHELHGVSAKECLSKLEAIGVNWAETPPFFRYGTFIKKEEYTKAAYDPRTQQE